jgi:membrane associated rhomboid family serine protease
MSILQQFKYELQRHSKLKLLLIINFVLFFIINLSTSIFNTDILLSNLAMPLNLNDFAFKFWTIITYMFSHQHFGHIFYNMLLLYFTAQTFLNFLSEKKLMFVYISSGISGGIILLLFSIFLPNFFKSSILLGASAAVLGIVTSLAAYLPNMQVSLFGLFDMKYKYFALLVFAISSIIDLNINTGGKISHFGGAAFGLLYGFLLKSGTDLSDLNFTKSNKVKNMKIVHRSENVRTTSNNNDNQKKIDELLDKISKYGYENLSKEEKEQLFKLSNKNQ